ncbi:MAG: hypothetical protein P4L43_00625 [Syntrophobacteraceae bacterium]|nr:hypothetical protein [Syntrophobacteraceae bacterium]
MGLVTGHHKTKNSSVRSEVFTRATRSSIISAYLHILEKMRGPLAADLELPFPKEQIAEAILGELTDDPGGDLAKRLEIGYVLLESFVPYEEYRAVEDFKTASLHAEKIADSRNPSSILKSVRIMKKGRGEKAVKVQERIHEKMQKRQLELMELKKGEAA